MPNGPQGQQRPADAIGNVAHIAEIVMGDIEATILMQPAKRDSGLAGANARQESTKSADRSEIARKVANAR